MAEQEDGHSTALNFFTDAAVLRHQEVDTFHNYGAWGIRPATTYTSGTSQRVRLKIENLEEAMEVLLRALEGEAALSSRSLCLLPFF
jgi:hypothetical protein